jgi:hypothetical protein
MMTPLLLLVLFVAVVARNRPSRMLLLLMVLMVLKVVLSCPHPKKKVVQSWVQVVFVEGGREPTAPEEWADQVPHTVHPQNLLILLRVMMPLLLLVLAGPGCD